MGGNEYRTSREASRTLLSSSFLGRETEFCGVSGGTKKELIGKIIETLHAYVELLRHHPNGHLWHILQVQN